VRVSPVTSASGSNVGIVFITGNSGGFGPGFCAGSSVKSFRDSLYRKLVEALRESSLDFYPIGDCVDATNIRDATRAGYFAAMNIL